MTTTVSGGPGTGTVERGAGTAPAADGRPDPGSGAAGGEPATWRAVASATGPADRTAAEAAVRLAYRRAGLAAPERVVWTGSPLEGTAAALLLTGVGDRLPEQVTARAAAALRAAGAVPGREGAGRPVRDEIRTRPWAAERQRLLAALGPAGWAERWALTAAPLWDLTRALADRVRTAVVEELARTPEDERTVRLAMLHAVLGQHDAPWLASVAGPPAPAAPGAADDGAPATGGTPDPGALDGLAGVARAAGWWWPYEKVVILSERPAELHRDEAGRLDRGDGPALAYPDGFALYAWRGMPVPAEFPARLADLSAERIRAEDNAELRRVMLEHYGYDRYLAESGARPLHRDETGVLWRIELPDDEPVVMVEVVNSTPEPDGTRRTYWLRVPPRTRTAREGVAWTFGLDAEEYHPRRET
ncbi:DUF6745 domain-containing protein [Streptomyces pactum]|uniref:DUF6745 domain-containing protein n=1 Tax=Streptomyces pactum TaxID=68249 RepID=UPI001E65A9E3|nr:hypothetical protein [Streptomyces pactum]